MNKARITYRFGQNEQQAQDGTPQPLKENRDKKVIPLYEEEFEVIDSSMPETAEPVSHTDKAERQQAESFFETHALNALTTDLGNWGSPLETESDRVERLIRESQKDRLNEEGEASQRPAGNADDWSSWTRREPWIEQEMGTRYAKSSGAPWIRIATSVAGAVVTGVAFGFFVLSMFSNSGNTGNTGAENPVKQASIASPSAPAASQSKPAATASNTDAAKTNAAGGAAAVPASAGIAVTPVQIPAKSYAFLQNGVFSTKQSAGAAQDSLKKKGLASALDESDKITVFAGFALNRDDALALSQQLQARDKQVEVYVKNMDLPAVTGIRWSGSKPEAAVSFLTEGDKLIRMISGLTVVHLEEAKPTALSDTSVQAVRTSHQALTALSASMNEGLDDQVKAIVQKMTTALNSSVQSMEEYKKTPSTAMLWQAQSSMMQYIIAQKALLREVSVS